MKKFKDLKERAMTDSEKKKREEIVLAMKDKKDEFKKKYGERWKEVMYATATKQAMAEAKEIDEISLKDLTTTISKSTGTKNIKTAMKPGEVKKGLDDLKKRLNTLGQSMQREAKDPGEYDQEGDMAKTQLKTMIDAAQELHDQLGDDDNLPEWVQRKITKATDYIDSVRDYMKNNDDVKESKVTEVSTPTLMKYRDKARQSAMKAKNSAMASAVRGDKAGYQRDVATMNKREKGLKNADRAAVRNTRKEDVMSADKKPEKYIKPDGKVGIRMVRVDKKVVSKDA